MELEIDKSARQEQVNQAVRVQEGKEKLAKLKETEMSTA